MTKADVLKDYPGIPSDAELGIFLFFYGTIPCSLTTLQSKSGN